MISNAGFWIYVVDFITKTPFWLRFHDLEGWNFENLNFILGTFEISLNLWGVFIKNYLKLNFTFPHPFLLGIEHFCLKIAMKNPLNLMLKWLQIIFWEDPCWKNILGQGGAMLMGLRSKFYLELIWWFESWRVIIYDLKVNFIRYVYFNKKCQNLNENYQQWSLHSHFFIYFGLFKRF